jgi:hypothetical protein
MHSLPRVLQEATAATSAGDNATTLRTAEALIPSPAEVEALLKKQAAAASGDDAGGDSEGGSTKKDKAGSQPEWLPADASTQATTLWQVDRALRRTMALETLDDGVRADARAAYVSMFGLLYPTWKLKAFRLGQLLGALQSGSGSARARAVTARLIDCVLEALAGQKAIADVLYVDDFSAAATGSLDLELLQQQPLTADMRDSAGADSFAVGGVSESKSSEGYGGVSESKGGDGGGVSESKGGEDLITSRMADESGDLALALKLQQQEEDSAAAGGAAAGSNSNGASATLRPGAPSSVVSKATSALKALGVARTPAPQVSASQLNPV